MINPVAAPVLVAAAAAEEAAEEAPDLALWMEKKGTQNKKVSMILGEVAGRRGRTYADAALEAAEEAEAPTEAAEEAAPEATELAEAL